MKFTFFEVKNFKGIEFLRIDFRKIPHQNVYTLVGLNESGKTTILEAINFFSYKSDGLGPLDLKGYKVDDVHDLIPIGKRDNFNEEIKIKVGLELDQNDELFVTRKMKKELSINKMRDIGKIEIEQIYPFNDSKHDPRDKKFLWLMNVFGRKVGEKLKKIEGDEWNKVYSYIIEKIPNILYFPNFLFDFPDKIYLESVSKDSKRHEFYKLIIQDILDCLKNDLDIDKHIVQRIKSNDKNDKRDLDSVLLKMSRKVTDEIFTAWSEIFNKEIVRKEIKINCDIDENENAYLEFKIQDEDGIYYIRERSLGFRWFFAFLLLTQFRKHSKDRSNVLFLLDEPASNLHSTAQAQLLKSFEKLPSLIYTTHSHHMINPKWLEGTYVVKNEGLNYDNDEESYSSRKTKISIDLYKNFATKYPDQTNYFQPILDILDYYPGELEMVNDVVVLEGKFDYYNFNYFKDIIIDNNYSYKFIPGTSAGNHNTIIKLYLGWGKKFLILLDSDEEGKKQKQKYLDEYGLILDGKIYTLDDINPLWKKSSTENLFESNDKINLQKKIYPAETVYNKKHFNKSVQEMYIKNEVFKFDESTTKNFKEILEFLKKKLNNY